MTEVERKRFMEYKPPGWKPNLWSTLFDDKYHAHTLRVVKCIQRTSARQYALAATMCDGILMGFEVPRIRIKELREHAAWNTARARRLMGVE